MAAAPQRFVRFEQVLEDRTQKHCGDQQNGRKQRATQRFLTVFTGADEVDRRDQNHQQNRQVPQVGEYFQRLLQCRSLQAAAQRTVTNKVRHRATYLDDQHAEHHRGKQPGEHCNAGGDVTAQLAGDLRTGQCIAQRRQKADHKQRPWRVAADHAHRSALVPGVEHHDHAEQHRGGHDAAAGRVGKTQRQRTADRCRHEVTDVQGQRQADDRRQCERQDVFEQRLAALANVDKVGSAQANGEEASEGRQHRERADPHKRQGKKVAHDTPPRARRAFVDQLFQFIGCAVGAQSPGIEQVVVQIKLFLDVIDAGADGPKQTALHQKLGGRIGCGRVGSSV